MTKTMMTLEPLDEGYDALPSKKGHLPPGSAIYFNNQVFEEALPQVGEKAERARYRMTCPPFLVQS